MRRALSVLCLVAVAALTTAAPTAAATGDPVPPTRFLYADANQLAAADGTFADVRVEQPVVGPQDFHSNAEVAAESADGRQVVEIGWIVDHDLNGDGQPHLFVFHWVNGVGACYNGCGWVPLARAPFVAGQALPVGATMRFEIQHVTGDTPGWQLGLDAIPIGEFPDSLWNDTYTRLGLAQWFGEVAASASQPPCTAMGDGELASSPTSAQFSGIGFVNGPATNFTATVVTDPALYTVDRIAPDAFHFGGPGDSC